MTLVGKDCHFVEHLHCGKIVQNVRTGKKLLDVTLAREMVRVAAIKQPNIMKHKHNWCCHPPEGQLKWGKSWEENEWDEEAMSENRVINSEEYQIDLRLSLEDDPMAKDDEFWPQLTEWCSSCKSTRKVKFVLDENDKKDLKMENVAEKKLSLEGPEETEKVVMETLSAGGESESTIDIDNVSACSQPFQMQLETFNTLTKDEQKIILFWRPWEEVSCCEATTIHEHNCEATSLLSSKPVTPPLLVTPPNRSQVKATTKRNMTRNMRRLLDFQVTLENEKGLPPSRWVTRLDENLERGDATPILGSPRKRTR